MTISLENLFRQSESLSTEERSAMILRYFNVLSGVDQASEEPISRSQIVPAIKDQLYFGELGTVVKVVREHFVADLWIAYVRDLPTRMLSLMESELPKLGLAREVLRELAIENLKGILPDIEKHGDGSWFMVTAGDYTASVLLLDAVWEQLESDVAGDLVVAAPTRDVLLVTGTESTNDIATIRAKAIELEQGGSYAISQTLLRRRNGKWESLS